MARTGSIITMDHVVAIVAVMGARRCGGNAR
jgi:hypothetical protein